MKIVNLKDNMEYIEEVSRLTHYEWGTKNISLEEHNIKIQNKIEKIKSLIDRIDYCKLLLIDNNNLIGFISIFPSDGIEGYTPWYSTMYVKEEYRGLGYSKLLNDAIIKEAKSRGFEKIYLKSELVNYYEKFGAIKIKDIDEKEKLYYIDLKK